MNICQSILKSCKTLRSHDSPDVRADDSTGRTLLQDSGHRSSGIGHTVNPLGTGHTNNRLDHEHSVRRSGLVRSDAMEHGSDRTRHRSDVSRSSRRDSITHRQSISLRHTDPGELSPASMIRHRRSRSCSSSFDSVSPRRHSRSPSRSRRKKKSHRRGSSLPLLVLLLAALPLLPLENEKESSTSLKEEETLKSCSSNGDKREKKHKRKRSSPFPSSLPSSVSSDSSSSLQRSPARKKSRVNSRSPSPADDNPHSASRSACPASHLDHLNLFAGNDDEFNSHSEDNQDLAPDTLRHSGLWSLGIGHTGNSSDH